MSGDVGAVEREAMNRETVGYRRLIERERAEAARRRSAVVATLREVCLSLVFVFVAVALGAGVVMVVERFVADHQRTVERGLR